MPSGGEYCRHLRSCLPFWTWVRMKHHRVEDETKGYSGKLFWWPYWSTQQELFLIFFKFYFQYLKILNFKILLSCPVWVWAHDPKIECGMLSQLSQPEPLEVAVSDMSLTLNFPRTWPNILYLKLLWVGFLSLATRRVLTKSCGGFSDSLLWQWLLLLGKTLAFCVLD